MRRHLLLPLLLCATALPAPAPAAEDLRDRPAVARPVLQVGNQTRKPGTVFFLPGDAPIGAVAVGTAHSFDLAALARAGEVRFELGRSQRDVAVASRFLVEPGRPFLQAGSLRDDYLVFALDLAPRHVRVLQPASALPREGDRVRVLGIPRTIPQDEDDIFGRVTHTARDRIEVDLDVPMDLRGWGGAPVLAQPDDRIVGMLQAAIPRDKGLAIAVSPISAVLEALERPLDQGRGRPFAAYASVAARKPGGGAVPRATASRTSREGAASVPQRQEPTERKKLLRSSGSGNTQVVLEIEHPLEGAVIGTDAGAFVAGRAVALRGELRRFDVIIVIDTSASTKTMSGADINGNGITGQDRLGGLFGGTDSGDSVLAAEVAAARQLLLGLDPRSTRVGLVTFSGAHPEGGGGMIVIGRRRLPPAITEEPLTRDYERIEQALDRVLERGPEGNTHMAAGVDQATIELLALKGSSSERDPESQKIALFFTDGQPTLPYEPMMESENTRAVFRAADRARKAGVRIHSFAIGPEALDGPVAAVEIAARTAGFFTPVRHPGDLVDLIDEVSFANLEDLTVRNLTTGKVSDLATTQPDGSWGALVELVPGKNRIEVTARASDGTQAVELREVHYAPGAPDPVVPAELLPRRTALLERRLVELRRARLATERKAAEQARKELLVEIEEERDKARKRAEQQRKELELEARPDEQ